MQKYLEQGVLVAVSGGADSMALLCYLHEHAQKCRLRPHLAVGHVNHGLRGRESEEDAIFVQQCTQTLGVPFFSCVLSQQDWQTDKSGSFEAAARNLRYDFLLQTAHQLGFRYIATAHTADDQAETLLHRIVRGTGVAGLTGIPPQRALSEAVSLIRPLLSWRRHDVLRYLAEKNQNYRTDSTNLHNDFTRNKIRNRLLPLLREEYNPEIDAALTRLTSIAHDNHLVLQELSENLLSQILVRKSSDQGVFDKSLLSIYSDATVRELLRQFWTAQSWPLRAMGFEQWSDLAEFVRGGKGTRDFPGGITAQHQGVHFQIQLRQLQLSLPQDEANSEGQA